MIDMAYWVEVVFQLINFGVLIALAGFVFKKYLLDSLRAQMVEQINAISDLKNSFHQLTRRYQLLNKEIDHEQSVQYKLKEKVMRWRADVEQVHEQLLQEREGRKTQLTSQMKHQIKHIRERMLYRRVLSHAIEDARIALQKKFADPALQKEYLDRTINTLKRK